MVPFLPKDLIRDYRTLRRGGVSPIKILHAMKEHIDMHPPNVALYIREQIANFEVELLNEHRLKGQVNGRLR